MSNKTILNNDCENDDDDDEFPTLDDLVDSGHWRAKWEKTHIKWQKINSGGDLEGNDEPIATQWGNEKELHHFCRRITYINTV